MQIKKWNIFCIFDRWKSWVYFCLFFWYPVFILNWTLKVCCINFAPDFVASKRLNMQYIVYNNSLYIQDSFFTATVPKWAQYICIRTVSSYCLMSVLLIWFKLVYGSFEPSKMHHTLDFCPDQPGWTWMYQR